MLYTAYLFTVITVYWQRIVAWCLTLLFVFSPYYFSLRALLWQTDSLKGIFENKGRGKNIVCSCSCVCVGTWQSCLAYSQPACRSLWLQAEYLPSQWQPKHHSLLSPQPFLLLFLSSTFLTTSLSFAYLPCQVSFFIGFLSASIAQCCQQNSSQNRSLSLSVKKYCH